MFLLEEENMEKESYTVYKHTSPNNKVYIGITLQKPKERFKNGKGYNHNLHFNNAIQKYGWENINHEILYMNLSKEEAEQKEIELISKYKSNERKYGYNISNGGNSNGKHSESTKKKISNSLIGHKMDEKTKEVLMNINKGRKLSYSHKLALINANTGRKMSEENKEKLRQIHLGKKRSEETKKKLSESHKGKPTWNKGKKMECTSGGKNVRARAVIQYDVNWNYIKTYECITIARKETGASKISECCRGVRKSSGGYFWRYA